MKGLIFVGAFMLVAHGAWANCETEAESAALSAAAQADQLDEASFSVLGTTLQASTPNQVTYTVSLGAADDEDQLYASYDVTLRASDCSVLEVKRPSRPI